jgi:hypothetical protein
MLMKKALLAFWITVPIMFISMIPADKTVDDQLLAISKEYLSYELYNRNDYWTISLCEPYYYSPSIIEDTLQFSHAGSTSPHGDKLYKLYTKYKEAYHKKLEDQPEGQVVIKEVWNVRQVPYGNDSIENNKLLVKRSMNDLMYYTPSTRKQLFIMYKAKPTAENDKGWWYGIVDIEKGADNAEVIESMKINRCVACHEKTKHDRMLGKDN